MVVKCPLCNIMMYQVINEQYPNLDTYFCYGCGFHADTILIEQKELYQQYQWLYFHTNGALIPKKLPKLKSKNPPTEFQQRNKTPDDETEPNFINIYRFLVKIRYTSNYARDLIYLIN